MIDTITHEEDIDAIIRKPFSGIASGEVCRTDSTCLYHVNLGSAKYRLDIP